VVAEDRHRRSSNVALLIDAENASPKSIDPVLTVLAELGTVNIRRVYGNWSKAALKGWSDLSLLYAIEPHQQFDISKGKNATDMKMTIDAMDLLFSGRVTGFGTNKTPVSFKQACTRFIDIGAIEPKTPSAPAETVQVDREVIDLLLDAFQASKRDERGFASLGEVGQRAGNRSSFDARNYGFSRLSELIEAIPQFVTERREGGQVYVKRR
jgi:hypothetical protein